MTKSTKAGASGVAPRSSASIAAAITLTLCVIGITVSALSTSDHVRFRATGSTGACAALVETACGAAHASTAAELFGVPISHYGTAFYLAGAALAILALARRKRESGVQYRPAIGLLIALMGLGAVGYSVFLATLLIRAEEACPLCIALYVVNVGLLATGLVWWLRGVRRPTLRPLLVSGVVGVVVGGGFFAVSTPFVSRALTTPPSWDTVRVENPAGTSFEPFLLPERVPSKGGPSAADELVEFSDLECPYCSALHRTVTSLFEERGQAGLRVRFVHYPLDSSCNPHARRSLHPTACLMARAGICAQGQGRFWEFIDEAFALEGERSRGVTIDIARRLDLDLERFGSCLDDEATARTLADDIELAHRAGIRATPTLLINGLTFEGALPRTQLTAVLNDTAPLWLRSAPKDVAQGERKTGLNHEHHRGPHRGRNEVFFM